MEDDTAGVITSFFQIINIKMNSRPRQTTPRHCRQSPIMSTDCFLQCAEPFAFTTDHTLKVTHHNFDTNEIMIALKLHGIMSSSLLLIGLMVIGLGIYQYGNKI